MNSRERLLTAIAGGKPDHIPLTFWCFGIPAPPDLMWERDGVARPYWYTGRLEHIHTLPSPWIFHDDDFERVKAWATLGVDDVLEVSVPWSIDPSVGIRDGVEPPAGPEGHGIFDNEIYPTLWREYDTPAGTLRHAVRNTGRFAEVGPGWVVQPDHVELMEDFNIPRGVKHALATPDDLPKLHYLLQGPTSAQLEVYRKRMAQVRSFAEREGVLVTGWSGFGMDLAVWLMGVEEAVMAAMEQPDFFGETIALIGDFDRLRTEVMLDVGGVDVVAERGWYSSTDFWSPRLFGKFLVPQILKVSNLAHQGGAKFAYTMTMGAHSMADLLVEAGVDLLYYVDPVQDKVDLASVKAKFRGRIAVAGGVNSAVTLGSGSRDGIRQAVRIAAQALGPDGYIMAPVDAIFPDTPWTSVEAMIEAWREVR